MRAMHYREFDELSTPEKIQVVQDLWDRIASDPQDDFDLTPAQREELERRLRGHEKNPGDCISWEELFRQLKGEAR